jgi:hypothetical protein
MQPVTLLGRAGSLCLMCFHGSLMVSLSERFRRSRVSQRRRGRGCMFWQLVVRSSSPWATRVSWSAWARAPRAPQRCPQSPGTWRPGVALTGRQPQREACAGLVPDARPCAALAPAPRGRASCRDVRKALGRRHAVSGPHGQRRRVDTGPPRAAAWARVASPTPGDAGAGPPCHKARGAAQAWARGAPRAPRRRREKKAETWGSGSKGQRPGASASR